MKSKGENVFFKKEIEIPVDVEKLKKELLSLSNYAILEDERKIGDLLYLLNGAMFGDGSYTSEAGMKNSLIVALSIICELQSAQLNAQRTCPDCGGELQTLERCVHCHHLQSVSR